ncbi:hypothetical protein C8R45DRAFT_1148965 [Mycena sanguinolenta]|nr:hypothetical protein C8R45DRAFT_1148965 [Mycena sanguinolenta]
MPPHPNRPNNNRITIVPRVRYSPPVRSSPLRNRLNSEMGIIDATTLILLHKMMADSYEHGRVVWKENRARCARTSEAESDELPCGPNSSQKKVEAWLRTCPTNQNATTPPSHPRPRLPAVVFLGIVNLRVVEVPPLNLWSAVHRGTAIPVVGLKPNPNPKPALSRPVCRKCVSLGNAPVPVLASPSEEVPEHDTLLATAFRRALSCSRRSRTTTSRRSCTGFASRFLTLLSVLCLPISLLRLMLSAPSSRRNRTQTQNQKRPSSQFDAYPISQAAPDVRWYHLLFLVFLWHFLIVALSVYAIFHSVRHRALGLPRAGSYFEINGVRDGVVRGGGVGCCCVHVGTGFAVDVQSIWDELDKGRKAQIIDTMQGMQP